MSVGVQFCGRYEVKLDADILRKADKIARYFHQRRNMTTSRDKNRDFSERIKNEERVSSNSKCRICGSPDNLEFAHIYSNSKNPQWIRKNSSKELIMDDSYVCSQMNCIVLCHDHHSKIDSTRGLEICDVDYLKSLKETQSSCTAIIASGRCKKKNSRLLDGGYRCKLHKDGGFEGTLPNRTFVRKKKSDIVEPEKSSSSYCMIL
jgi:hypothetical protein